MHSPEWLIYLKVHATLIKLLLIQTLLRITLSPDDPMRLCLFVCLFQIKCLIGEADKTLYANVNQFIKLVFRLCFCVCFFFLCFFLLLSLKDPFSCVTNILRHIFFRVLSTWIMYLMWLFTSFIGYPHYKINLYYKIQ